MPDDQRELSRRAALIGTLAVGDTGAAVLLSTGGTAWADPVIRRVVGAP